MSGNSGVAMHQWRIAYYQPPHLACIAPWEATTDLYRESIYEGICTLRMNLLQPQVTGPGGVDDCCHVCKYPLMNGYWKDKIPDLQRSVSRFMQLQAVISILEVPYRPLEKQNPGRNGSECIEISSGLMHTTLIIWRFKEILRPILKRYS